MATLLILFDNFNGIRLSAWWLSINPNSLAALLATVSRALMVFILSSVHSHWKWTWMGGSKLRSLSDFRTLDLGSRGLFGAILVCFRFVSHHPVPPLAAAAVVCSLSIATCVQQSIAIVNRSIPADESPPRLPYAHSVPNFGAEFTLQQSLVVDVRSAISTALSDDRVQEVALGLRCDTGNCTFPTGDPFDDADPLGRHDASTYSTLGMCHTCTDISGLANTTFINTPPRQYEYSHQVITFLPNGHSIAFVQNTTTSQGPPLANFELLSVRAANNLSWVGWNTSDDSRAALRWSVANFTVISRTSSGCSNDNNRDCKYLIDKQNLTRPLAAACYVYTCRHRYLAPSVQSAKLKETFIDSTPLTYIQMISVPGSSRIIDEPFIPRNSSEFDSSGEYFLGSVKSPCKVNSTIYTYPNMSSAPVTAQIRVMTLNAFNEGVIRNMSVPQECLYQMPDPFWKFLRSTDWPEASVARIFEGSCDDQSLNPSGGCFSPNLTWYDVANKRWLMNLTGDGMPTFQIIDDNLARFALSMINSFRASLGTRFPLSLWFFPGKFDPNAHLPIEYVQGTTLIDVPIIEVTWGWLILPTTLSMITAVLLVISIAQSWRDRYIRPVWKDNILIPMMYRQRFEASEGTGFGAQDLGALSMRGDIIDVDADRPLKEDILLDLLKDLKVRFDTGENIKSS